MLCRRRRTTRTRLGHDPQTIFQDLAPHKLPCRLSITCFLVHLKNIYPSKYWITIYYTRITTPSSLPKCLYRTSGGSGWSPAFRVTCNYGVPRNYASTLEWTAWLRSVIQVLSTFNIPPDIMIVPAGRLSSTQLQYIINLGKSFFWPLGKLYWKIHSTPLYSLHCAVLERVSLIWKIWLPPPMPGTISNSNKCWHSVQLVQVGHVAKGTKVFDNCKKKSSDTYGRGCSAKCELPLR